MIPNQYLNAPRSLRDTGSHAPTSGVSIFPPLWFSGASGRSA